MTRVLFLAGLLLCLAACGGQASPRAEAEGADAAIEASAPEAAAPSDQAERESRNSEVAAKGPSERLFVWCGDADGRDRDFLAVVDAEPASSRYGRVLTTLPVDARGTMPHHTEHVMPPGGVLFANGFHAGRTFLLDLRRPPEPRLAGSFEMRAGYSHPHSFERLPGGNVLTTFQGRGDRNVDPGGLVELDPLGEVVRSASADDPRTPDALLRPYSLAPVPHLDRVVVTSYDMGEDMGMTGGRRGRTRHVQVWRLSDLEIVRTFPLPHGPKGYEGEQPGEPRLLADGRTVLVATFTCGLHRITGLTAKRPSAELVHSFDGGGCALPVVVGDFWVQSVPSAEAVVALDVSDPATPREVSRVDLGPDFHPHWLSLEPGGDRIVVTDRGDGRRLVVLARIDRQTGELAVDESFREEGAARSGLDFERLSWPHGETGPCIPHGAVFERRGRLQNSRSFGSLPPWNRRRSS